MAADKHPHLDTPSVDDLRELIDREQPGLRNVYLDVHRLVIDTLPDIHHSVDLADAGIGYGAHQYGYAGWGMATLLPHRAWVSLVLFKGTALDDPDGLLEGTGASVRHVKVGSVDELAAKRESIRRLLAAASRMNEQQTVQSPP